MKILKKEMVAEIAEMLDNDQFISAIKLLKDYQSWDLRTTKNYLDNYRISIDDNGIATSGGKRFYDDHIKMLDTFHQKCKKPPKPMTAEQLYNKIAAMVEKDFLGSDQLELGMAKNLVHGTVEIRFILRVRNQ